jgi:uncharacterized membrane protein
MMTTSDLRAAGLVARAPLHPTLMSFSTSCFVGTLLTDIAYARTANIMWADFSAWLIAAGVILGWLAGIAGIVDLVGRRYLTAPVPGWAYAIGILAVMILATFNMLIHTRDAWTSVVPWGLTLSAITLVLLVFTTAIGWIALYRRNVVVIA